MPGWWQRIETEEFGEVFPVFKVSEDAFFDHPVEFLVEFIVLLSVIFGRFDQELQETIGNDIAQFLHELGVLHTFA